MDAKIFRLHRGKFVRVALAVAAVVMLVVAVQPSVFAADDELEAKITALDGTAAVLLADTTEWVEAQDGMPLSANDRIRTGDGAGAELSTSEGTVLHVDANSEVSLDELKPESSIFSLSLGSIMAKVLKKLEKVGRVEVHTPTAVVAVRGTEFAVDVNDDGKCETGVFEGKVAVQGTDAKGVFVGTEESLVENEACEAGPSARPKRVGMPERIKMRRTLMRRLAMRAHRHRMFWQKMTPEQRQKARQGIKNRWAQMPPEQRQAMKAKILHRWQNMPPAKRERIKQWQQKRGERMERRGEKMERTGERTEKRGERMDKRGERMQQRAEKLREAGHERAAAQLERRGEKVERRGEAMDRKGERMQRAGERVQQRGERMDNRGGPAQRSYGKPQQPPVQRRKPAGQK